MGISAYIGVKKGFLICALDLGDGSEEYKAFAQKLEKNLEFYEIEKNLIFMWIRETDSERLKEKFIKIYKWLDEKTEI